MVRLVNRVLVTLSVLTAVLVGAAPAPASDLPSPFAAASTENGDRLVAIVTADIDADGDLDVIASDTALQIHIWVNDGAGHLTPRDPVQTTSWQGVPPLPSVDARPITFESCTPANPLSIEAHVRIICWTLTSSARLARVGVARHASTNISTRIPRAPPAFSI